MRKTGVVVSACLAACGGDDGNTMVDARPNTGPNYDLSCLNYAPTTVPNPIEISLTVLDLSNVPAAPQVAGATVDALSATDGTTVLTSATTDDMGRPVVLSIPTTGTTPIKFDLHAEVTGFPKQRAAASRGAWKSDADIFPLLPQTFVDGLYTALGATPDATKGTLVVVLSDCSNANMTTVTPSLMEDPGATWAMYGGIGAWIVRPSTVGHPMYFSGSYAGVPNVTPGLHTIQLKTLSPELPPVSVHIVAGELTTMYYYPGIPRL